MVKSSETQKQFEARNKVLTYLFLAKLSLTYRGCNKRSDMFYDKITKKVIRIHITQTSKPVLMEKLSKVRGTC